MGPLPRPNVEAVVVVVVEAPMIITTINEAHSPF